MSASIAPVIPVTNDQLAALSKELVEVGGRLENHGCPDWLPVARAAALIDALRHQIVVIPTSGEVASHG